MRTLEKLLGGEARFESRLIAGAPHMIVASHAEETAGQILEWIREAQRDDCNGVRGQSAGADPEAS